MNISSLIDHTELRPEKNLGRYTEIVREAIHYKFGAICVSSFHTPLVSNLLHSYVHTDMNLDIKVASTIGFPHGNSNIESKVVEMKQAFNDGATEFDFVMNLSAAKTGDWKRVRDEFVALRNAVPATEKFHPILKVILETGYFEDDQIKRACDIAIASKLNFVKSSTGFNIKLPIEKTAYYVKLMKECVKGSLVLVKASGGIKTLRDLELVLEAGADRIGTSSGVQIMEEWIKNGK